MQPTRLLLLALALDVGVLLYGPRRPAERTFFPESAARHSRWWLDSLLTEAIPRMAPVELRQPTVVVFYPDPRWVYSRWRPAELWSATSALRREVDRYRSIAAQVGYELVERYNRGLLVVHPDPGRVEHVLLPFDRVGFVVAVPGQPPEVHYGLPPWLSFARTLRAYLANGAHRPSRRGRAWTILI